MTLTKEQIVNQIFSINQFYRSQKVMGPLYRGWIKNLIDFQGTKILLKFNENDVNELFGFAIFSILKRKPFITLSKLAVKEGHTSKGIGKGLLDQLKKIASNHNIAIQTKVARINERAINFYQKNNFVVDSDDKNELTVRMVWE